MNPRPRSAACCSAAIYLRVADQAIVEEMPGITLKGIDEPVSAYILKGFPQS